MNSNAPSHDLLLVQQALKQGHASAKAVELISKTLDLCQQTLAAGPWPVISNPDAAMVTHMEACLGHVLRSAATGPTLIQRVASCRVSDVASVWTQLIYSCVAHDWSDRNTERAFDLMRKETGYSTALSRGVKAAFDSMNRYADEPIFAIQAYLIGMVSSALHHDDVRCADYAELLALACAGCIICGYALVNGEHEYALVR